MKNFLFFLLLLLSTTGYSSIDCTPITVVSATGQSITLVLPTTTDCDNPIPRVRQREFGSTGAFTPSSLGLSLIGTVTVANLEPCTDYQFLIELLCDGVSVGGCVNAQPYSTECDEISCDECIDFSIFTDDISGCDATFIMDYSFNDCGPISIISETWSFGGTGLVGSTTFPSNGTYTVTGTVVFLMANGEECEVSASTTVNITDCGISCEDCINLEILTLDIDECNATFFMDYNFNNCGPISNVSHSWDFGGTGISGTNTFPSNGTYTVTGTVTFTMANGEECEVSASTTVNITDCFNCDDCIDLDIIVDKVDGCDVTVVMDYSFNDCGPITILGHFWDFGEGAGFNSGGLFETHTYSSNGTFTIRGIVIYRMGNGQVCFELATATVTITDCEDDECLTTAPTDLSCQYFGAQLQLTWDPVPNATCYIISIEPGNLDCCKPVPSFPPFSLTVPASTYPRVNVPNTAGNCFRYRVRACCEDGFSPWSAYECKTANSICPVVGKPGRDDGSVSADINVNVNSVKVFPNPSSNHFNIAMNFETPQNVNIRIMDSTGKLVYSTGERSVDAGEFLEEWTPSSDLSNGLYILEINTGDQVIREKMILQR